MRNQSTALTVTIVAIVALGSLGCLATAPAHTAKQPAPATGAPATTDNPEAPSTAEPDKPVGPVRVSVRLANRCGDTVKLFFGDKPKYGSGTYSTLSDNNLRNQSFDVGDQVWIVDDSQNGVSNAVIAENTRELEVTGNCDSFKMK